MNMNFLVLSGLLFLTLHHDCVKGLVVRTDNGPIVETITAGTIRGLRSQDDNYNMFLGIPYATVNESNPFGPSVPHSPFEGIFDAYDDTAICPQIEEFNFAFAGSLDCLHLNIHVPDTASPQNRLPVMVYIYGGAFHIGFAGRFLYGPEYLIRNDVILVTLNYRLGAYGFMCLDIPEVPGNQGLKDQVLALRWIKNNIEAFGGDPDKVTVFGNSAGGASIGLHLISETEQLFESGIQQSGSAFLSTISETNPSFLIQLASEMGFAGDDIYEALSYVSQQDVQEVVVATIFYGINFGPCIENKHPNVDQFLSQRAFNSNHSKALNVKMMVGFNSEEFLPFFQYANDDNILLAWGQSFAQNLRSNFKFSESQLEEKEGIVRRFYIGDEEISNDIRSQVMHFSSDMMFLYPAIRSIKYILNGGAEKVYQYVFSYDGQRNFLKVKDGISEPGAAHADEIGYLFKMEFISETPNAEDQLVIDRMTTMWTNFAKYGDPTPSITSLLPIKWEAITKNSPYNYININTELSAGRRYETKRMSFWDLFYNAFEQYEVGYEEEEENGDGSEEEPDTTPDPDPTPDTDPTPDPTPDPTVDPDPTPDPTPDPDPTPEPDSANTLYSFKTLTLLVTIAVSLLVR